MAATDPKVEFLDVSMPNGAAADALKKVIAHLSGGLENGLLMMFITRAAERSHLELQFHNVCRHDMLMAAVMLAQQAAALARACPCPEDHSAEIEAAEAAAQDLASAARLGQQHSASGAGGLH